MAIRTGDYRLRNVDSGISAPAFVPSDNVLTMAHACRAVGARVVAEVLLYHESADLYDWQPLPGEEIAIVEWLLGFEFGAAAIAGENCFGATYDIRFGLRFYVRHRR